MQSFDWFRKSSQHFKRMEFHNHTQLTLWGKYATLAFSKILVRSFEIREEFKNKLRHVVSQLDRSRVVLSRDFFKPFPNIKIKEISIHLMPHNDVRFRTKKNKIYQCWREGMTQLWQYSIPNNLFCAASTETLQVIIIRLVLVSVSFSLGLDIETLKISVSVSVSKLRLWKI